MGSSLPMIASRSAHFPLCLCKQNPTAKVVIWASSVVVDTVESGSQVDVCCLE